MRGTFAVTPGQVLYILVGGLGGVVPQALAGGGGGASFVSIDSFPTGTLLLAASGGGGASRNDGGIGFRSVGTTGGGGTGFTGGGGAGNFNTACGNGGQGIVAGGNGGVDSCHNSGGGGYGGGGSGGRDNTFHGGGGGGGYNGGNGGGLSGGSGGRSFNLGTNPSNSSGINNGDGSVEICYNLVSLPIELSAWNAKKITDREVLLTWQTASEENNHYFSVERSKNGMDTWEEIAQISGHGNHIGYLEYRTTDKNPLTGISYYRLKQVDFDETSSYSALKAIHIDVKEQTDLLVYPSPTQGLITITMNKSSSLSTIRLFNMIGEEVRVPILSQGETKSVLDCSKLKSGLYIIRTQNKTATILKY